MGAADKLFAALKDMVILADRVKTLDELVVKLNDKVEFVDRRLVRVETIIELASSPGRANLPELPKLTE